MVKMLELLLLLRAEPKALEKGQQSEELKHGPVSGTNRPNKTKCKRLSRDLVNVEWQGY